MCKNKIENECSRLSKLVNSKCLALGLSTSMSYRITGAVWSYWATTHEEPNMLGGDYETFIQKICYYNVRKECLENNLSTEIIESIVNELVSNQ